MKIIGFQKILCNLCKKEHLVQTIEQSKEVIYNDKHVVFNEVCCRCLNILDNNLFYLSEQIYENKMRVLSQYRINEKLLSSQEIIDFRKKYNLTASELSILLGWNPDVIDKIEHEYVQDKEMDNLLRKAIESPAFMYHRLKRVDKQFSDYKKTELEVLILKEINLKKDYVE